MVAPLVGYSQDVTWKTKITVPNVGVVDNILYSYKRNGFKQSPPFNLDTAFSYEDRRTLSGWSVEFPGSSRTKECEQEAINKARAKFVAALGESSQLGSTLTTELRPSWGTVVSGLTKMLESARALRHGDLVRAAGALGGKPPTKKTVTVRRRRKGGRSYRTKKEVLVLPSGKYVAQTAANYWLWWSYAIKPLAGDIQNAMDVLTRPAPFHKVEGSASAFKESKGLAFRSEKFTAKSSVCISANVRVANPNLWLANQLGLINPVQWINEGIPFSFVLDWFSNLSQVINQMTDFVGLEIANPITTSKHVGSRTATYPEYKYLTCVTQQTFFTRVLVVPRAKFIVAYERFEWQRGANAVSLLVGMLNKAPR